jgi:hypothetical protein
MYGIEEDITNDITITVNGQSFSKPDMDNIQEISSILNDSGEIGEFELGNLIINISELKEYQDELIHL